MQINIHPDAGIDGFASVLDKLRDLAVEVRPAGEDGPVFEGAIVRVTTLGRPRLILMPIGEDGEPTGPAFDVHLTDDTVVTYL